MDTHSGVGVARSVCFTGLTPEPVAVTATRTDASAPWISIPQLPTYLTASMTTELFAAFVTERVSWEGSFEIRFDPVPAPDGIGGCDVAIAVAIARAIGLIPHTPEQHPQMHGLLRFYGQLDRDGYLRVTRGSRAAASMSARHDDAAIIVPANSVTDTCGTQATVHGAATLRDALRIARYGHNDYRVPATTTDRHPDLISTPDLNELHGLEYGCRAMEIAAAGAHHILLAGAANAGAVRLAEHLPSMLPPLTRHEADEVDDIYSLAGHGYDGPHTRPPYVAPHFSSTMAAMVGASTPIPRPGAVSLAHHGVLVLDEAPEFRRDVIEVLRQPLRNREVRIVAGRTIRRMPAAVHLVLATRWCPAEHDRHECDCGPAARSYMARIPATVMRHVPIRINLPDPPRNNDFDLPHPRSAAAVRTRVIAARARAAARWGTQAPGATNQTVPTPVLNSLGYRLDANAAEPLNRFNHRHVTVRRRSDVARVAWSIADLAAAEEPNREHVVEAMGLCGIEGGDR